ncbi:MAG: hypothetical protein A3J62_03020 [Candidatus Buchananbacteria bacterium RIFCSPHIGHO2_02_FULL_38_8]|uniref:PIN domain-containing protein n=1 Tax=Candidatus Buchananbacteria bacterium RIFCSPHIGHO2_02_FULL_38_8 TaxID=1797538 RepID=A0A1G1Y569_9BACT|nr:MAG: hypothetical protein A3J62_03020 [Candidatus Buchananbacteria bacterium RIFCSPHIGHO2_02_FULL_38_8]
MKTSVIDANIIIRFLLHDHPSLSSLAKSIFLKAEQGKIKLYFDEVVIAEVVWTLSSCYKIKKADLVDRMEKLLSQDWVVNSKKNIIHKALLLYASSNLDYIDCWVYIVSKSQGMTLKTFDKKLKKLSLTT